MASIVEALEARALMTQGSFGLLGSGGYGPAPHSFFIDSVTSTPPNANNVIDVAPGTGTTAISLHGHVLGPGPSIPGDHHESVRVNEFPTQTTIQSTVGNRVEFDMTVSGVPLGESTFSYRVSKNGDFADPNNSADVTNFTGSRKVTINATPVAVADSFSALKGRAVQGNVLGNDHDGDNSGGANPPDPDGDGNVLTANLVGAAPPNAAFALNPDGSFTYTPDDPGFVGAVTFKYRISDGRATPSDGSGSDTTTVTITNSDAPPVVAKSFLSIPAGSGRQALTGGDLLITDADDPSPSPPTITLESVPDPQFGSLVKGQGPNATVLGVGGTFTQDDVNRGDLTFVRQDLTMTRGVFQFNAFDGTTRVEGVLTVQVGNGVNSPTITRFDSRTVPPTNDDPLLSPDDRPTFGGDGAPAGSVIKVYANDDFTAPVATGTADGMGTWTATASPALADGAYIFTATATDGGTESVPGPPYGTVLIDTTGPSSLTAGLAAQTDTGTPGDSLTGNANPVLTGAVAADVTPGSASPPRTLRITLTPLGTTAPVGQALVPETGGTWTIPAPGPLKGGTYAYTVTASDDAGNSRSTRATIVVDPDAPVLGPVGLAPGEQDTRSTLPIPVSTTATSTILVPLTDQTFKQLTNTIRVTVTDGDNGPQVGSATVTLAPGADATGILAGPGTLPIALTSLAPGNHALRITARDEAGNVATASFAIFIGSAAAPTTGAPGTPVYATILDLSNLKGPDGELLNTTGLRDYPWSMSFDRTTQTVWVLLRGGDPNDDGKQPVYGGNRVIQIDPATSTYRLYNLQGLDQLPENAAISAEARAALFGDDHRLAAGGPHGVAFDFESHLTPRIWFTQMVGGLVSFIDVEQNKLYVYDVDHALKGDDHGAADTDVHAIAVDSRGVVWISDESDSLILELRTRQDATLNASAADLYVHKIPDSMVPNSVGYPKGLPPDPEIIGPHGIDVVVSETTGQPTVYFTMLGAGSVIRLVPGTTDVWREYRTSDAEPRANPGLPLFVAIDTNETPGDPGDDRVYFGDPGYLQTGNGGTIIGELDPATGDVTTWTIPAMPGGTDVPQPNQTFVDREGNLFYIDRSYGFGRLDSKVASSVPALGGKLVTNTRPAVEQARLGPYPLEPTELSLRPPTTRALTGVVVNRQDRSATLGLDQYDLLAPGDENRGDGPFRGTISASNVLFGSLTQSDKFVAAVFAETARRQVAAVELPGGGRATFAVGRDGKITVTEGLGDAIKDIQRNLTEEIAGAPLIDGDVSAQVDQASGTITLFGRDRATGGMAIFTYRPDRNPANRVESARVVAPLDGAVLVNSPTSFVDPVRGPAAAVAAASGHVYIYFASPSQAPFDVTKAVPGDDARMYGQVGVGVVDGRVYIYGGNQTGSLLEVSYAAGPAAPTVAALRTIAPDDPSAAADTKVLQGVDVLIDGNTRHVFATDGGSRLVHYQIGAGGKVKAENVTSGLFHNVPATGLNADFLDSLRADGTIVGYSDYQMRFAGRVNPDLAPVIDAATGDIYVYGTNGRDLIQFHGVRGGADKSYTWSVVDLTNNTSGAAGGTPANRVFGAPSAYISADGSRHVLQMNEDGDVIEFFQLSPGAAFSTQNITLSQFNDGMPSPAASAPDDAKHPTRIGPRAVPLTFNPAASTYSGSGTIRTSRDRYAFQFRPTTSGRIRLDLDTPSDTFLAVRVYVAKGKRGHRKLGNGPTFSVQAGRTYYVVVQGTRSRRASHGRPARVGFGHFDLSARLDGSTAAIGATVRSAAHTTHHVTAKGMPRPFHAASRPWATMRHKTA